MQNSKEMFFKRMSYKLQTLNQGIRTSGGSNYKLAPAIVKQKHV
jgi:hypothetical protein